MRPRLADCQPDDELLASAQWPDSQRSRVRAADVKITLEKQ
jgi:hypothetical protein